MRLYKNVTKTLLAVKTPRRMYIEPNMVIDVDSLGEIQHTDIAMFMERGMLAVLEKRAGKKVQPTPVQPKTREVKTVGKDVTSTTKVEVAENKTVVIRSSVPQETEQATKTEMGTITRTGSSAAVVNAPADSANSMSLPSNQGFKGASFDALPVDIREKVAQVEAIIAASVVPPVKKKSHKKKAPVAK